MAEFASGLDEAKPVFWFANQAVKVSLSYAHQSLKELNIEIPVL